MLFNKKKRNSQNQYKLKFVNFYIKAFNNLYLCHRNKFNKQNILKDFFNGSHKFLKKEK